jgi:hypothetical protein
VIRPHQARPHHEGVSKDLFVIRVAGEMGATSLTAFPDFDSDTDGSQTTLRGELPDRQSLYRTLTQLEALGLEVIDIRRCDPTDRS